jgi:hypothetical protein
MQTQNSDYCNLVFYLQTKPLIMIVLLNVVIDCRIYANIQSADTLMSILRNPEVARKQIRDKDSRKKRKKTSGILDK